MTNQVRRLSIPFDSEKSLTGYVEKFKVFETDKQKPRLFRDRALFVTDDAG